MGEGLVGEEVVEEVEEVVVVLEEGVDQRRPATRVRRGEEAGGPKTRRGRERRR